MDSNTLTTTLTRTERAEQTAELLRQAYETTDEARRDELRSQVVLINRGVAESVAMRYRGRGVATEDLYQVAYEGLTKAVQRFDAEMRKDLLTFAVPTIRGELQRYFRDLGWTVRPPRRIQELQGRANQAFSRLSQELGREPTPDEVAAELDISPQDYRDSEAALGCFTPTSLDQPAGESTATVGDLIIEDDDSHEASEARVMLAPVVRDLSERDRRILYLRFFEDRTQSEIGEDLGVTQMQVSRLLSRILGDMREELEATG
ncbi:sigma-70 family RNA polymerase sigma factor [Nocardioides pyridinolyticus]